jgi:dTDP-L-rhamnose 4-epimerase
MENPFAAGHTINIASGHSYTIDHVARLLAQAMDVLHLQPRILNKARAGDIRHCFANIGNACDLLNFHPRHLLEESLDELVDWISASNARDHGEDARQQLETRGLVI